MKTAHERAIELREQGKSFSEIVDIMKSENYTTKTGSEVNEGWAQNVYYTRNRKPILRRLRERQPETNMVTLHEPAHRSKVVAIVGDLEDVQELLKAYL